jgi:hypothetical protein
MKKFLVFALAVLLVAAFALPASAVENQFGGYWRTRMYTQQNFTCQEANEPKDKTLVDTRTRLYYTAIFHDDLKFVNKFELDAIWGGQGTYGDVGADQIAVEVKNSYVDFNWMDINFKVGVQYGVFCRGLLFADDFAGVVATYKADNFTLPFVWVKVYENSQGTAVDANSADWDVYGIYPSFTINDVAINPFIFWGTTDKAGSWNPGAHSNSNGQAELLNSPGVIQNADLFYMGVNVDYKTDVFSAWGTFIYETGSADLNPLIVGVLPSYDVDINGYLLAFGGNMDYNQVSFRGQVLYATGDNDSNDMDIDDFFVPAGQDYHWAEILGGGIFGDGGAGTVYAVTNGGDWNWITNIFMWNVGITFNPWESVKFMLDVYDANLAEAKVPTLGNDHLGTEIDARVSMQLIEGLNLDIVAAYLWAGEAIYDGPDDTNPYEIGGQLSLSF